MIDRVRALRRTDAGRFVLASALGALLAVVAFLGLGSRFRFDLFEWQRSGNFYDAQAESWLDGTWQVSGGVLGIERFESHGGTYMYQGPWPALLRVPVVAVTDRFDGRLSLLSMTLGVVVALAGTTSLHWRVRRLARGDQPLTRAELVTAAAVTFAVGAGSAIFYEASRPWVYHEAAVWGAAWAIVGIDATAACIEHPTRRRFLWAAVATTLALCSRSSVGLAGVAALGLLAGGNLLARWRRTWTAGPPLARRTLDRFAWAAGAARPDGRLPVVAPGLAAALPLAIYAGINWIKFRTLFSIPFYGQGFTILDEKRQAFLDANNGTLFGLKFLPTTLVQYTKPNAFSLTQAFPFVDFPAKAEPLGGIEFDLVDYSSSAPSSMPVFALLAVVGLVVLLRRSTAPAGQGVAALRVPAVGALVGAFSILPFGYIANRYLADTVPVLLVTGLVGLHAVLTRSRAWRVGARQLLGAGLVVLMLAGLWVNLSHALLFQRLYSPNVKDDLVAGFLDTRFDVAQSLGLDPPIPLAFVEELPMNVGRGVIAIVGDCDAMYLSDGLDLNAVKFTPWNPVERTEAGGRYLRRVTFPEQPPGTRAPLATMRSSAGDGVLTAEWKGGAGVVFQWLGPGEAYPSRTWFLPGGTTYTMDLVIDPRMNFVQVFLDDKLYYENLYLAPDDAEVAVGVDILDDPGVLDAYVGELEPLPERNRVCRELRQEAAAR